MGRVLNTRHEIERVKAQNPGLEITMAGFSMHLSYAIRQTFESVGSVMIKEGSRCASSLPGTLAAPRFEFRLAP